MEYQCDKEEMMAYLQNLVGSPLAYGIKAPDWELYDLGFGTRIETTLVNGRVQKLTTFVLHSLSPIRVIKPKAKKAKWFYEDTPSDEFDAWVKRAIGLTVKRVGLSDKNDLWLDLGKYWIVLATDDSADDSVHDWCFFTANKTKPFLMVSAFRAYKTRHSME